MAKRDYYEVLGVSKGASETEIKKAFRRKAMDLHPDRNQDDPKAESQFKEINEAYEILKDGNKKAAYDRVWPCRLREWRRGTRRGGLSRRQ